MAVHHQLIERPPSDVWAVLAEPRLYGEWVVGPSASRPQDEIWPQNGARIAYTVRFGPWTGSGTTTVRAVEPLKTLELEADSGRLGTARIAIELKSWGAHTLVVLDEHPLRGTGATLHNTALDALLQLRHRKMLTRLSELVERQYGSRAGSNARTGTADPAAL
ncbi:SRPBCC family protein [Streptomyces sp. NPDC050448]|uniref:SRPBCC family protein n=1 Tax=Streptomyces sp. NPDC050448 TaxID=3155404 RepID=UPI0034312A6E